MLWVFKQQGEKTMKTNEASELVETGIAKLATALAEGHSDNLKNFLKTAAAFHRYSLRNWMLIYSQCPDATKVCGYIAWQKLGRQVRKGEKGLKILVPIVGKKKDDSDKEQVYFGTGSVFDIAQTDGEDLPTVFDVAGEPGDHLAALEDVITTSGLELNYVQDLGGALGVSRGGTIDMIEGLDASQRFTTLVHEFAHEKMHWGNPNGCDLSKKQKETEAEAVAYVVGQAIGVDSLGQTADYVQLYKGDLALFKDCLTRIQKCAKQIIQDLQKVAA
jgi:antirestriction protein ArdC